MPGLARFRFVVLAMLAAGCDSDESILPIASPITLELGTHEVKVVAGLIGIGPGFQPVSQLIPITIKRNGYTGVLTVTTEPLGAAGPTFGVQMFGSDSTGGILVSAANGVAGGTYKARVVVATDGAGNEIDTVSAVVVPFSGRLLQRSITVVAGTTNTVTLELAGSSSSTTVTVNPGAGVTTAIEASGGARYIDITSTAVGTHFLDVTATNGTYQVTWPLQVDVIPAPSKTPVSFRLCRNGFALGAGVTGFYTTNYIALGNEGEPWVKLTADANGVYSANVTNRVRVAEVFNYGLGQYAPGTAVRVLHMTAEELGAISCGPKAGTKVFRVRASNATPFFVAMGGTRALSTTSTSGVAAAGPLDLVATGATGSEYRSIVRRDVELASGDTIVVDFASGESVVLDSAMIAASEPTGVPVTHVHTSTTVARLGGVASQATNKYWALREAQLAAGDVQSVLVGTTTRGALNYFRAATPLTVSLGPELAAPVIDTLELKIRLPRQTEYPDIAGVGQLTTKDGRGVYNYTEIWQTKAFASSGSASEWVFSYPDLGRLLRVEALTQAGTTGGIAGSGKAMLFFGAGAVAGDQLRWAKKTPTQFGMFLPYPTGY